MRVILETLYKLTVKVTFVDSRTNDYTYYVWNILKFVYSTKPKKFLSKINYNKKIF